jgi:hypothetical protein
MYWKPHRAEKARIVRERNNKLSLAKPAISATAASAGRNLSSITEAILVYLCHHVQNDCRNQFSYLITPRSEVSINRISMSTSSPRSGSAFIFSNACEVFSLEASRSL